MEKLIEPKSNPKLLPNEVRYSTQQMQLLALSRASNWVRFGFDSNFNAAAGSNAE